MALPARISSMSMTVEAFLSCSLPEGKAELVRGELRVTPPPDAPHGTAATNLVVMLAIHVRAHGLGRVFTDGFGYELVRLPRTVREKAKRPTAGWSSPGSTAESQTFSKG